MAFEANQNGTGGNSALVQAYQPIVRGYFMIAGLYYAIMTLTHFWFVAPQNRVAMMSISTIAMLVAAQGAYELRRPIAPGKLEALSGLVNALVILNIVVALHIEFAVAKLVYFIMAAMIFAFASVTLRQAVASVAVAIGAMFYEVSTRVPGTLTTYVFVAFAGALSALAIAYFLKRAIVTATSERRNAEWRLREAEQISDKMRKQSRSDELTGLPNRRAFFDKFEEASGVAATGTMDQIWLALLDLDGFKAVNDNYGHMTGDTLLREVATRLKDYCGEEACVCRMGGDEFNIILPAMHSERQLEAWAGGLLAEIGQVYLIDDRLVQISGSIGCCRITGGGDDKVVQKADYALMHAKRNGKDRVVVFREEHEQDAAERFAIEQALRIADFDAEIELLFQPQYRLGEQRFAIAEALARWNSPTIGKVEPDRFITIAEESGLIAKITLAVVDKALAQVAHWDGRIAISINLSGHDLLSDQIINQIVGKVRSAGVDPALVEFEVTETAMMVDLQRAIANLNRLAQLGHGLALDDFGTGYSNFTYLRSLPIGKLKVDRSFMQDVADPMTEKVLRSLVGMARTLDVECLLEGVESELELALAKRVGAQSVQGYLFGRPMTAGEVIARHGVADNPAGDAALRA